MWLVAALWLLASCVTAVAASGGEAQRGRARSLDRPESEAARAAAIPSPGCRKLGRAPRIGVELGDEMEFDIEGAASQAKAIMRATGPGLCTFAQVHDPERLREALAVRTYDMTTVSFRGRDMTAADVLLESVADGSEPAADGLPSKWRVGVERESDDAPWHVVSAVSEP